MMDLREAEPDDSRLLAAMFRQMWLDNGIAADDIVSDWEERIVQFVEHGRRHLCLRAFFAVIDGEDVGGAVCQRFAGLYPNILIAETRRYGYVWGVYVAPAHRRAGVGARLTQRCNAALKEDGCTHVVLHAAPMGRRMYAGLGFEPSNEMRMPLGQLALDPHLRLT